MDTLSVLEAQLHVSDDPEEIAHGAMKMACDFYQADWCGFLEVDLDLGLWTPYWWYNTYPEDKTMQLTGEFESAAKLPRWVTAMKENKNIAVLDAEEVRESFPEEYAVYQQLQIESILAVPVKPRPMGFLAVRNPKRFGDDGRMLRMLAYVVLNTINQHKHLEGVKMSLSPEAIQSDKDIIVNFFGNMEIYTSKGVLRELDFNSPKASRVIVSTANGYRINPDLHIMMDKDQFDNLWTAVQHAAATSLKVDLIKQAIKLYKGQLFESASSEHWIMSTVNQYSLRYVGLVNELLSELAEAGDFSGIHQCATAALNIMPGNVKAHFWLIFAMYRSGAIEMSKCEISRAKAILTDEEYGTLIQYLKENRDISPISVFDDKLRL